MSEHGKHIAIGIVASVVLVLAFMWHRSDVEEASDRAQLNATLKQQGDVIAGLQKQISVRDAAAVDANKAVDKQVSAAKTDPQLAALIAQLAGMSKPPTIVSVPVADGKKPDPDAPSFVLSQAQGKQLADFEASCKKCENDLTAATGDKADLNGNIVALTKQRDEALTSAHGGTKWQRMKRAMKWFGYGALAGGATAAILKH